jgi:PAS domain S-box-containing protein
LENAKPTRADLLEEIRALQQRLEEAEETLHAIRHGEVDALVVSGAEGDSVFTLQSTEQPYRILVEQMQEGALTLSTDGLILYSNLRFAQMLGQPYEKVMASAIQSHVHSRHQDILSTLLKAGRKQSARSEITLCGAGDALLSTYITVSPITIGDEKCLCMVVTDLTEQESMRRNQAEIEQLNERLRRSMTETHHRVKNNLQIIGAMVDMQVMQGGTTLPMEEARRLAAHVKSLAVVHELLTQEARTSGDAEFISSFAILERLLAVLEETIAGRRFQLHIEDTRLSSRAATGLALVTNELISNAVKYGSGTISVTFEVRDSVAALEVCDEGPGFPVEFDPDELATTGISLVENVSRWDLGGDVQFRNRPEGGASVRITMPTQSES